MSKVFLQRDRGSSLACQAGGGKLATAKTLQTIQPLIEAMNLLAGETGEYWVGGRKNTDGDDYIWEDDTPVSINDAWDDGYPESGICSSIVNQYIFVNDTYQVHFVWTLRLQMDLFAVQAAISLIITSVKSMKMLISVQQAQVILPLFLSNKNADL